MGNYNCSDDICSQFLNKSIEYYECNRKSNGSLRDIKVLQRINGKCHFMDGSNRAPGPVGLISPPGSGNTWVRGLLEQATGICTGEIQNGDESHSDWTIAVVPCMYRLSLCANIKQH